MRKFNTETADGNAGEIKKSVAKSNPAARADEIEVQPERILARVFTKTNRKPSQEVATDKLDQIASEISAMGTVGHPLIHKLNEEHVTKVLDLIVQHDQNEYELIKQSKAQEAKDGGSVRLFVFLTFLILVGLTVFVLIFFKDKPEIVHPILTGLGGLIAGGLGGYNVGRKKD